MLEIFGKVFLINVCKVFWICVELDLFYCCEDWGSGFCDIYVVEFFVFNLNVMVLVLCDGELVFWEFNSIICYLVNCYVGECFYLQQVVLCVWVDQWLDWQVFDFNCLWSYVFMSLVWQLLVYCDVVQVEVLLCGWMGFMEIFEG